MQLIRALLIAAIVVIVLSGISIFFGSHKQEKKSSIYFLFATASRLGQWRSRLECAEVDSGRAGVGSNTVFQPKIRF